jgi:hypothetical protein
MLFSAAASADVLDLQLKKFLTQQKGNTQIERMYGAYLRGRTQKIWGSTGAERITVTQLNDVQIYLDAQKRKVAADLFRGNASFNIYTDASQPQNDETLGLIELITVQAAQSHAHVQTIISSLEHAARGQAQNVLSVAVADYESRGGTLQQLKMQSATAQYHTLFPNGISIAANDIDAATKPFLQSAAEGFLKSEIRETKLMRLSTNIRPINRDNVIANMAKTGAAFVQIAMETAKLTTNLANAQFNAKTAFQQLVQSPDLADQLKADPADLKSAADLLSGSKAPKEIVSDLLLRHGPGEVKQVIALQKEFAASHANLKDKAQAYLNGADIAVGIAANVFKVDPKVVTEISRGVSVA